MELEESVDQLSEGQFTMEAVPLLNRCISMVIMSRPKLVATVEMVEGQMEGPTVDLEGLGGAGATAVQDLTVAEAVVERQQLGAKAAMELMAATEAWLGGEASEG